MLLFWGIVEPLSVPAGFAVLFCPIRCMFVWFAALFVRLAAYPGGIISISCEKGKGFISFCLNSIPYPVFLLARKTYTGKYTQENKHRKTYPRKHTQENIHRIRHTQDFAQPFAENKGLPFLADPS